VSGLSESQGKHGDRLTIWGCGFSAATEILFTGQGGADVTSFTDVNDGSLVVTVPTLTVGVTYDVQVVTLNGTTPPTPADQLTCTG